MSGTNNANIEEKSNLNTSPVPQASQYSTFFFITFFYFVARMMLGDGGKWDKILLAAYVFAVIIYEFNNSLNLTKEKCGTPRFTLAFYYVVLPWLMIFGTLNAMLIQFPGWKAPFANTFGYLFLRLSGIQSLMFKILKPVESASAQIKPSLQKIYMDQSMLINEITPQNFDLFWNNNKDLFNENAEKFKSSLRSKVVLKDAVSEFIWFYMAGTLIMALSFNYISAATCNLTPEEMKINARAFEADKRAREEEAALGEPQQ